MRIFLAGILIFPFIFGCVPEPSHIEEALLMDTFVRIEIVGRIGSDTKKRLADRVIARMKELEKKFDYFSNTGELAMINRLRKDEKFRLSPEMFELLKKARKMHIATRGAFDITKGRDNWRLDRKNMITWFRKDGVTLDLGGIAKGFIVDEGIKLLEGLGVTNALITAGGDMYCLGDGPRGRGWKVGIRNPRKKEIVDIIRVSDRGVATSGGYERALHIIDPATEKPVEDALKSVTVVAPDCATADALATALFIMEPKRALRLIERINDADCIIIDDSGFMYVSSGLAEQA
jgi:thiamine biosynthesis lipoprotein